MKAPSPLLGFNNNFKHKGHVYHVQTEDSGIKYGHIITHLFADGGRILKSIKTSYAPVLGDPQMADIVRQMMKDQHKAMIVALRDGQFDPGGAREVQLPTTGVFAGSTSAGAALGGTGAALARASNAALAAQAAPIIESPTEGAPDSVPRPSPEQGVITAPSGMAPPSAAILPPPEAPEENPEPIDIPALERAAAAAAEVPRFQPDNDLPPPPAQMLGRSRDARPKGGYVSVAPGDRRKPSRPPPPAPPSQDPPTLRKGDKPSKAASNAPPRRTGASIPPGAGGSPSRPPAGRYALTRPASIFATNKPQGSLFGEDLISERSLDEVILSYLAEDLEGEQKK